MGGENGPVTGFAQRSLDAQAGDDLQRLMVGRSARSTTALPGAIDSRSSVPIFN